MPKSFQFPHIEPSDHGDIANVKANVLAIIEKSMVDGRDGSDIALGVVQALREFVIEVAPTPYGALLDCAAQLMGTTMTREQAEAIVGQLPERRFADQVTGVFLANPAITDFVDDQLIADGYTTSDEPSPSRTMALMLVYGLMLSQLT